MENIIEPNNKNINLFPKTLEEEILRNVATIIASPKYSVPLDRGFGISNNQLDTPANIAQPKLIMEIIDAVEKYEPRAEITKIEFRTDEARAGILIPRLGVKLKNE